MFHSERDGDSDIYTMLADGTGIEQLTDEPGRDYEPDASPDGTSVVFASQRDGGENSQLYILDLESLEARRLTFAEPPGITRIINDYPEWAPDGRRIVFQRSVTREGGDRPYADIWLIDPQIGEEQQLTDNGDVWDSTPSFSADGKAVFFESNRDGNFEVYRQTIDGGEAVRLTESAESDGEAKESPDGRYIAFSSKRDGDFEIYLMNADGSDARALTSNDATDRCPQWSPDGKLLSFHSDRDDGDAEVYVMKADGSDQRRLTNSPGPDAVAAWLTSD